MEDGTWRSLVGLIGDVKFMFVILEFIVVAWITNLAAALTTHKVIFLLN